MTFILKAGADVFSVYTVFETQMHKHDICNL